METTPTPTPEAPERAPTDRRRSWIATAAIASGLAIGAAGIAGAATGGSGSSGATDPQPSASAPAAPGYGMPPAAPDGTRPDPSTMANGPGEELLTGDLATRVRDAALEEVPGATVIRVETDSGDAAYEAHLQTSDGGAVTVLFDENLDVVGTEDGFGPGPRGQMPPRGQAPSSDGSGSSNATTSV